MATNLINGKYRTPLNALERPSEPDPVLTAVESAVIFEAIEAIIDTSASDVSGSDSFAAGGGDFGGGGSSGDY